jgi:hypothetical protein
MEGLMTKPSEYREYAREAMQSADQAPTEAERKAFLSLARKMTEAAIASENFTQPVTNTAELGA